MVRILELYSGTKSVSRTMLKHWPGADVVSVDISPQYGPDILADIGTWNFYDHLRHGEFDVVWASPPCTQYSRANRGVRDLDAADQCVQAAFNIIEYLQPRAWFVENPASGLLARRPFMAPYAPYRKVTTYCMFGTGYRKATHLWTNVDVRLPACSHRTGGCAHFARHGYHAEAAQKGPSRIGGVRSVPGHPTSTLWRVPEGLVLALCRASGIA
eukprot:jgi/Tetstr1/420474/TSEL_011587.t1